MLYFFQSTYLCIETLKEKGSKWILWKHALYWNKCLICNGLEFCSFKSFPSQRILCWLKAKARITQCYPTPTAAHRCKSQPILPLPCFDFGLTVFLTVEETKPVWGSSGSLRISAFLSQEKVYETIGSHLNSGNIQTN